MSITIGRRWPGNAPRGDYTAMCDICGVHWRRSKMFRDRAGHLRCPDDKDGADILTLALGNAKGAAEPRRTRPRDPSNYDGAPDGEYIHRTTIEEVELG